MTENKRKFSLFRKKEDADQKEAEAKTQELEEKKQAQARAEARKKTEADIRARHEESMEAAKAKIVKHVVVSGDTLSGIAKKYYDDAGKYMKIYEANKDVIGDDPNMIKPGQELVIPKL